MKYIKNDSESPEVPEDDDEEDHREQFVSTLSTGLDEKTRTVYLVGEIDEQRAYHFMIALSHLDSTDGPIRVVISSIGGAEYYGYAIYDALRNVRNTVVAEGYGLVASMAAAVFQAADIRLLSENCEYMIHNGSIEDSPTQMEQDLIEKIAQQIKLNKKKYHQILYNNSDLSIQEIEKYCKEEKFFSAKECIDAGLADHMIKPRKKRIKKSKRKKGK
jgi:ATP-dependent protease ClpP protease subunit